MPELLILHFWEVTMRPLVLLLLVVLLIAMLPAWPYSAAWGVGYFPSGILAFILLIVVLMSVLGRRGAPRL